MTPLVSALPISVQTKTGQVEDWAQPVIVIHCPVLVLKELIEVGPKMPSGKLR